MKPPVLGPVRMQTPGRPGEETAVPADSTDTSSADVAAEQPSDAPPEQAEESGTDRSGRFRRWPWVAGAAVLLVVLAYVGFAAAVGGRVPRGVEVAGVDIGGQSQQAAVRTLHEELDERITAPVPVALGAASATIDPTAAGLAVDLDATVDDLVGFSLDPRVLWRHAFGSREVRPEVSADQAALTTAVEGLAAAVNSDAVVEGAIAFAEGRPVPTAAQERRSLDVAGAVDRLATDWFSGDRPLALPGHIERPIVDQAAVDDAMASFATPATAGPLTFVVAQRRIELEPAAVTPALAMEAVDGRLEPRVDGAVLAAAVTARDPSVVTAPRNATVRLESGVPTVVPAQDGTGFDPAAVAAAALEALPTPSRTATVSVVPAEAEVTTAEAQALGVKEPVSEFATNLTPDARRTQNLTIAAATVNGTLLLPGQTFSLNDTLGERTPEKGYNEAPVIESGRLTRDVGGGVSQMATTLFNAMFFAGLEDVEHKPHSFYISRYPEGREATVNYPNVDLKFRNDSPYGVLMETWVGDGQVHARFWSTKVWDEIRAGKSERSNYRAPTTIHDPSPECVSQSAQSGFDVTVTRTFVRGGVAERTEEFYTRYIPEDRVICGPPPAP
jgi:vancomycin resistance protein YoaR